MSAREAGPRLGRGLAALIGDQDPMAIPQQDAGVRIIPLAHLEPGPMQPRKTFREEPLAELVESIRKHGVLQPLLACIKPASRQTPGGGESYQIIAGERRWRAAQLAGLHDVPVLIRHFTGQEALEASLVENLQREDLNPIEEAEGFRRLLDEFGLTQEQLAAAVGKSRSHISNATRLLALPASVREAVQQGTLTAGHARALLMHGNPEAAARLVIARGLNVRQTEALASSKAPAERRDADSRDPETVALERDLSERLGLRVQIAFDGKGGTVSVHYRSLDQLDGLLMLLNR